MMYKGNHMPDQEIDRILSQSTSDEILPSLGFTATVMEGVRREAGAPPAISFPWKRALPGLAAGIFTVVLLMIQLIMLATSAPEPKVSGHTIVEQLGELTVRSGAGWILLALMLSLISVKMARSFVSRTFWIRA
jgi:hypothetical protein